MSDTATIYRLTLLALWGLAAVCGSRCPVLECWYVQEKAGRGGGFPAAMTQEKSLLYVRTEPDPVGLQQNPPSDIDPKRIYYVTDAGASLCSPSLRAAEGAVEKPQCEVSPFLPQPALVRWAAPLTAAGSSPAHLQADWLSAALRGLQGQLVLSSLLRAPSASDQASVVLSVFSRRPVVRTRLGAPALLDCGFWARPGSPLWGAGFAVEWRYQFRGEGRLVLAYDGRGDRLEEAEPGAELDAAEAHRTGNVSLRLGGAEVRHAGTYICTVYLPYLLAQVAMELEVVEPPALLLSPSPLWALPGHSAPVQCEASGFFPLALELQWEFLPAGGAGEALALEGATVSGHRQGRAGTFTQSSRLELDLGRLRLEHGGQLVCVAKHEGGTRRAGVTLNIAGVGGPTVEDSMAMVAVALLLYGLIKIVSWTLKTTDSSVPEEPEKKQE
ncbi:TAP binding protein (tapasin), tandem duplicate 1 [Lepisosteus oculatus]|uniref:TAP binding protein (tapasin), tandem duplicate 1 n=1 Tax=Lepisosteus oculatus TaxID=7918 RepID=UPI0035F52E8C